MQIYVAYMLAVWTVIGVGMLLLNWNPPYGDGLRIGELAWESVLASIALRFQPYGFPILAFYVLILPIMPLMLYLRRRMAWAAWAVSAGGYITAQMLPDLTFHRFADGHRWYFNPLAWQFLFFIGVYFGSAPPRKDSRVPRMPLVALSIVVLALGLFMAKVVPLMMYMDSNLADILGPLRSRCWSWAGKSTLQPLRLIHFFSMVYLVTGFMSHRLAFWSSRFARPIAVCGQQSLEVYAVGLVASFVSAFVLTRVNSSAVAVIAADVIGCFLSVMFAYGLTKWKSGSSMTCASSAVEPTGATTESTESALGRGRLGRF